GIAEAGSKSGNGERRRQDTDPATGDRNYRAGDPEDVRLLPRQCSGRAHREDSGCRWLFESARIARSFAPGVLATGGDFESVPTDRAASRGTRDGVDRGQRWPV